MLPSNRRAGSDASPTARSVHGTLRPPNWTAPKSSERPVAPVAPQPLQRRVGLRADEAYLRARVNEARASGDPTSIRGACTSLARWLASRDRNLDEAVALGGEALALGQDIELRREVSGWLECLGEPARAAAVLKPLASSPEVGSSDAAYVLGRVGVLRARAGAAAAAATAFELALAVDGDDPCPAELLGVLYAWQPSAVPLSLAVRAYVEGARRRAALQQDDAELLDLWRAFGTDAANDLAARALEAGLLRRSRAGAADEVLRLHARALADTDSVGAARVHARRRASALAVGEKVRALGAALDQHLEAQIDGDEGIAFDALLLDLGMLDAVAAREAVRAQSTREPDRRAANFVRLARLEANSQADSGRAIWAYVCALVAEPSCAEALVELGALLDARELGALLDAREEGGPARPAVSGVDLLDAVASAVAPIPDEEERFAAFIAEIRQKWPHALGAAVDDETTRWTTEGAAWARDSIGAGLRAGAAALERFALAQPVAVRAVLMAAAAERHLMAGNATAARSAAEIAIRADPTNARCVSALADAAAIQRDRAAANALERAIGVIGPRPYWCLALADALDALGDTEIAAGWSQRCVSLSPGDRDALRSFVERLLRAADSGRLKDALAWVLMQPQPIAYAAQPFARALSALGQLDGERAIVVARRALDVFGPSSTVLREAMLGVADRASDDAFAVAILERWLAHRSNERSEQRAALVRLAELQSRLGDDEGHARTIARAMRDGFAASDFDWSIPPGRSLSPDAQLWRLRADADRLASGPDMTGAANALRDLGAAIWDMADDRVGAVQAMERAARLVPAGYTTLALDLVAVADKAFAFEYLARVSDAERDDAIAAAIATEASRAALTVDDARIAFDLASRAIGRSPSSADALEAAESAARASHELSGMSALYDVIAARALGRFGRRAAHYRAARWFERLGMHALSIDHAAKAFRAVPSLGSTLQLLVRAASRAGDRSFAVRCVEQVADAEEAPAIRASWLLRAASIADDGPAGTIRKADLLVRAVMASASEASVASLAEEVQELLRQGLEDREVLAVRLRQVDEAIEGRLNGPEGARIAIAFAVLLLQSLGDSDAGLRFVERAFACDADVDEYGRVEPFASTLCGAPDARRRLEKMLASAERPMGGAGVAALRLLSVLAVAEGNSAGRARAAVAAALRMPDDDRLVVEADDAIRALRSASGTDADAIADRIGPARRAAALLSAARSSVASGAFTEGAGLFERALDLLDTGARPEVEHELRAALGAAGRSAEIEARAHREACDETAAASARADAWTHVAELREGRGDVDSAARALLEACRLDPDPLARWSSLERLAEAAGAADAHIEALEQIWSRVEEEGRATVLKRLARAHERKGDLDAAERTWRRVQAQDAEDEDADRSMQAVIVARGDYDELVAHLARRAERLKGNPDQRELLCAVRLRRAAILEQRLGRIAEACSELELLLGEWPESVAALRYLADLYDRQSDYARSVPLWRRAAALEENPAESGNLEQRAARAAMAAGGSAAPAEQPRLGAPASNHDALKPNLATARDLGADAGLGSIGPGADIELRDLEAAAFEARTATQRASARLVLARARLDFGDTIGAEPLLWDALTGGLTEAGDILAPILASAPDRAAELVRVRWQLVALEPGEIDRLESLRAAALADDDRLHARAIDHVLKALAPDEEAVPPPPLAAQSEQQGMLALLVRPSMDAAGEAFALLWEKATQLFVRDAASYGITGVGRVVPGPSSPVGRAYDAAIRVLDVPRIPLFVTRSTTGYLDSQVTLMSPPAVILVGDVRQETVELRFTLGCGIAAALPQNVLRRALPRSEGQAVLDALRTAFGAPELGRQVGPGVARLAESFWQLLPASAQRRLQELLASPALAEYSNLVEAAAQSSRRVGMFLAGDFACAARAVIAERARVGEGDAPRDLPVLSLETLPDLCSVVPALADLLCLAVRADYADARWHPMASASQRRPESGRFSVF